MVKKRLALAAALLLILMVAGGRDMGICDIKYELITPDGQTFNFMGPGRAPGSAASLQAHEGFGLPPVRHVTQDLYDVPGNLLVDVVVQGRIITITESAYATDATRKGLHKALAAIWDAVRWDRGATNTTPSTLRYTVDGNSWDLKVVLSGVVESPQGRYGKNEIVGLRFEAHDPLWWDDEESSLTLDWTDDYLVRLVLSNVDGVWDNMGPPAAIAAGAGGFTVVRGVQVSPDQQYVYYGGDFQTWNNLPAGNHVVRWNIATETWEPVGGGLNNAVWGLYFGPDGTLYAVGDFTNGSGGVGDGAADYLARYDPLTDTWVNVGGGPGVGVVTRVETVLVGHDGTLYVGGDYTDWQGIGADYIVSYTVAGGWATLGAAALDAEVLALVNLPNGHVVLGGTFRNIGAVAYERIAEWDPVAGAFTTVGPGFSGPVYALTVGLDGKLYAGGVFNWVGWPAMILEVFNIAVWNGTIWSSMDGGFPVLAIAGMQLVTRPDGDIYALGGFQDASGLPLADFVARWNGFTWIPIDVVLPVPAALRGHPHVAFTESNDMYLTTDALAVTVPVGADNSVVNLGSAATLPVIEVKNQGDVSIIRSETTGGELAFKPMHLQDGEIVIVDLSTGRKTITSSWRGNRLGDLLPPGVGGFELESNPRAQYGGVDGANLITVFITDADPREHNDDNNQLSGWANVTGIEQTNTDLGRLYVSIVFDGVDYHVNLYSDAARTELVGHTADYAAPGAQVIVADNDSGLGGSITVDAVVAADDDIEVYFTIVTATWYNRWWSLSEAVLAAE